MAGVDTTHKDYDARLKQWERCRDVLAGEDAVKSRRQGKAYLPILTEQPDEEYIAYRDRAQFTNFTWRTVSAFLGMIFRKEPIIECSERVKEYLKDVTQTGVPFEQFARNVCEENLSVSRVGVLVDFPKPVDNGGKPLTLAQAEQLGLRPTMRLCPTESIINWGYRLINNKWMLSLVVLKEIDVSPKPDSEFESVSEERWRVLDLHPESNLYRVRVFKKGGSGADEQIGVDLYPTMNGKPMAEIPFEFITPNGNDATPWEPVILDFVSVNLSHYRTSADYEHALHMTALPTPYVTGVAPEFDEAGKEKPLKLHIGSLTAWVLRNAESKVGFLEFQGQGIDAIKEKLERAEAQMAAIGARIIAPDKAGVEAFKTIALRSGGEHAVLSDVAINGSLGLTRVLKIFAEWAGDTGEVSVELNKQFLPVAVDSATLAQYLALWQSGAISEPELYDLLQQADIVASDKSLEEHQAEIDANPPIGMQLQEKLLEADPADDKPDDEK